MIPDTQTRSPVFENIEFHRSPIIRGTEAMRPQEKDTWSREQQILKTDAPEPHRMEVTLSVARQNHHSDPVNQSANGGVFGTVLNLSTDSVLCEVNSRHGAMNVSLPRDFFPEDIAYGTPIQLLIEDRNGFRTPVVYIRNVALTPNPILDELQEIVDRL